MKLHIFTIVLDGEPFIERHLAQFEQMDIDWHWTIVHGAAANTGSTKWCRQQRPRLSIDGTTEYLQLIRKEPCVTILEKPWWNGGKDEMCNAAVERITEPCLIMQIDADELWSASQIQKIVGLFDPQPTVTHAYFLCRYWLGPSVIATGINCWSNQSTEWLRAWRFSPGMRFITHEPPNLDGNKGNAFHRLFTAQEKLIFDHYAYAIESQVAFKERFYGYQHAVAQWQRLQENTKWPVVRLKDYLPWVDERVGADKVKL